ncbi:hypothetical protein KA057_02525 [Candidatus Gracilibacteria bacterium]|nr:hypothetical protein [Candidatus Gracilibacteria bacterium]
MKNIEASGLSFMTFVIGIALGTLWFDVPYVEFDNKFDVSDVTNIFLTSFLAIFYTNWIRRKYENRKNSKQLIVTELSELCSRIEYLSDKMRSQVDMPVRTDDLREIMDIKASISHNFQTLISVINANLGLTSDKLLKKLQTKHIHFRRFIDLWEGKILPLTEFENFRNAKNAFLREIKSSKSSINLM